MKNKELQHHGIKDMHWGVRRFQNEDGSLTPLGKKRYNDSGYESEAKSVHEDYAKAHSGNIEAYSTKELQDIVSRLNLEKQYDELQRNSSDFARFTRGRKEVGDLLSAVGGTAVALAPVASLIANTNSKSAETSAKSATGKSNTSNSTIAAISTIASAVAAIGKAMSNK